MALRGFFHGSTLAKSKAPLPTIPQCGACGLARGCRSPKMPVGGGGRRKILVVGEAPGETEDLENDQFVGRTGRLLRRTLAKYDVDLDRDCWKTNALICRPPDNATPTDKQIGYCRPNLTKTLKDLQPEIIITLGHPAVSSLIGGLWRENEGVGAIGRWVGWRIPHQRLNAWICPTWHPSYIARGEDEREQDVAKVLWERHLRAAAALQGRPWATVPDYPRDVQCVYDPAQAARIIRGMVRRGGPCAWDYETTALKPEGPGAEIVSCSICWRGKRTIAYPWHGEAITATKEFIASDCPKIASNAKFEDRWTAVKLGMQVRRWWWDTMLGAHWLDNRKHITSIKFQQFVLLGADSYDDHIAKFLETDDEGEVNQVIRQVEVKDLLTYNGLDSLLEYKVAMIQREMLDG